MSIKKEKQGYALEGKLKKTSKGFLVLWSITKGRVSYANLVQIAKDNNLTKKQIPELRQARYAFAVAKERLRGTSLPTLLELKGWDGQVKQTLDIARLKKGNEYQISIKREGRMNGKLHKENVPIFRLEFSPPGDFDHEKWVQDYMKSCWDRNTEKPNMEQVRKCVRLIAYWDDTEYDANFFMQIRDTTIRAFEESMISIDSTLLRSKVEDIIFNQLHGIRFLAGRGAVYVPSEVKGVETSKTLDSVANMVASFSTGKKVTEDSNNYYDEDGEPISRYERSSVFRYLGYLNSDRELQYIREDIQNALSKEVGEYWEELIKIADTFNDDKVKEFEEKISKLRTKKNVLSKRIDSITSSIGGKVDIKKTMYTDLSSKFNRRIAGIPEANSSVVTALRNLSDIDN